MAIRKRRIQHEPLRVPSHWKTEDRAFVIQLERILDDIYQRLANLQEAQEQTDQSDGGE